MFDLNSTDLTDLATDFNEFNHFYKNDEYTKIERPQNPFHKNFQSYHHQNAPVPQRNSFTTTNLSSLLNSQEPADLKK